MVKNSIKTLFLLTPILLIFGCGGSKTREGFSQTYTSAVSIGDLIEVDVDTKALTFSYKVLDGDLKPLEGAGTLKPIDGFQGHAFTTDHGHLAIAIKDEVAIGAIGHDFFVGVPKRTQPFNVNDIAGVYNYVSYSPKGINKNALDKTSYGTVLINKDNTWDLSHKGDLTDKPLVKTFSGKLKEAGNGAIELLDKNEVKIAHLMIRPEATGEHFAIIDLVEPLIKGIAFGSRQAEISRSDLATAYSAIATNTMDKPSEGKLLGDVLTITEGQVSLPFDLKFNSPWKGLISGTSAIPAANLTSEFFAINSKHSGAIFGVVQYLDANTKKPSGKFPSAAFIGFKK